MELQVTASGPRPGAIAPEPLAHEGSVVLRLCLRPGLQQPGPVLRPQPCLEQAGCVPASAPPDEFAESLGVCCRKPPLSSAQQEQPSPSAVVRTSEELGSRQGMGIKCS